MSERETAVIPPREQQPEKGITFDKIIPWSGTVESSILGRQYEIKTETLHLGVICEASVSGNTC